MSGDATKRPGLFTRNASRGPFLLVGAAVIVIVVVVVVVVLITRGDDTGSPSLAGESVGTAATSPYDMTELPSNADLSVISKAAFISILVPNDSGSLTSYGISSDLPAAQALSQAVADAEEVDEQLAASVTASTVPLAGGGSTGTATITFVLASRETLTFALALDEGLIARGDKAWKPDGDLKALVQAAIKSPH